MRGPICRNLHAQILLIALRIVSIAFGSTGRADDFMNFRCFFALCSLALGVAAQATPASDRDWVPLPMNLPKEMALSQQIGPKPSTDVLHLSIGIPYGDQAGISNFVDAVSNPKSLSYRQFIPPEEVGSRFGISAANLKKVSAYLSSYGLKIHLVAKNRLSILAEGTVAQAEAAFNTSIVEFVQPISAKPGSVIRYSYTTAPSVPNSIRSYVTVIGGLENFMRPKRHSTLTPNQLQTLYGVSPIFNNGVQGQGRTIAISNWDGYRLANIPLEYGQFNLPAPAAGAGSNVKIVSINGHNGNTETYAGEGDIDIQCTLGTAPLCNLVIYDDANDSDLLSVLTQEANDNIADIVTESYGWSTSGNTAYFVQVHGIHLSMSAQGITYMAAAGDSGTSGVESYAYPDEDPEVLIVGGTSVTTDSSGNRLSESVWNNSIGAGGGGWAVTAEPFNVLPAYQKGNGVPTNIPYRLSPDIALDADPNTGYQIFMGETLEPGWGGTSCASPTAAGALADSEQQLIAAGALTKDKAGNQRLGRLQDLIYSYNGDPTIFFDVVTGNNGTLPDGSNSNAGPGWDTASGWGAPNFTGFVDRFLSIPVPIGLTISPTSVVGGTPATGTVTLNSPAPTGGTILSLSTSGLSATVPTTVTVAAGQTTATFSVATAGTTTSTSATVFASGAGVTVSASVAISPIALLSISISPTSVVGGNQAIGTVTLNGPAPAGGIDLSLSSNSSNVLVPQHVEVAAGAMSDTFAISTLAVNSTSTATITASDGINTASGTLSIGPTSFSGFAVSPSSVLGGVSATATVTLNGNAPAGGITVNLSSSNSIVSLPTTVTVPGGASSASVTASTSAVLTSTTVTLTASQGNTSFTTQLTLNPVGLSGLTLSPSSVIGGASSSGTINLNGPAPSNGLTVKLTSSSSNASIPASVTIPAGASSATFAISTVTVANAATATITATQGANSQTATLTINPPALISVAVSPNPVVGGNSATGIVTLNGPAGAGGINVALSVNGSGVTVPTSVLIPGGASSTTFGISTKSVTTTTSFTISATQGASTQTSVLTVTAPAIVGVSLSPSAVAGGSSSIGTVTLNGAAPVGGVTITLGSNSQSATVPTSALIPAGAVSTSFTISTSTVASNVSVSISATLGSSTVSTTLTIQSPLLTGITLASSSVFGGNSVVGTINLARSAPIGGVAVALSSTSSSASVPAMVTVPAGSSTANFTVSTIGVASQTAAVVSGALSGTTKSANLTIQTATLANLTLSPVEIAGGSTTMGTVSLNGEAPTGGISVNLSSNSANLTIPSSVKIPSGTSSATFNVSTKAVTTQTVGTVTAGLGSNTQSATITIDPASLGSLTTSASSIVGGSVQKLTGTVTFNGLISKSGATVSLKSSDQKLATVPATVKVTAGGASGTFIITSYSVTSAQSVEISAIYGGVSQTASVTLVPFQMSSLVISPTSVPGGTSATAVLSLNAIPGPTSGSLTVKLVSSSSSATVPVTVIVPVGLTSAKFAISTKAVSVQTIDQITASLGSSSIQASLTILPPALASITVSPAVVKGSSTQAVTGTVTLSSAAPTGGITVTLSSSDSSAASVPTIVTILAGKTSASFKVSHSVVTGQTIVTVSVALAGATKTATLTVNP